LKQKPASPAGFSFMLSRFHGAMRMVRTDGRQLVSTLTHLEEPEIRVSERYPVFRSEPYTSQDRQHRMVQKRGISV
jgi:hypothetical protein